MLLRPIALLATLVAVQAGATPPPAAIDEPTSRTYHFQHMSTGARRLRGGAFPLDVPLYARMPPGLREWPKEFDGARFGFVRVPENLVQPTRTPDERAPGEPPANRNEPSGTEAAAPGAQLVVRTAAVPEPAPNDGVRFRIDFDGDGSLSNERTHFGDGEPAPPLPRSLAPLLTDISHGHAVAGGRELAFIAGRLKATGALLVLLATDPGGSWEGATALMFEGAPHVEREPDGFKQAVFGEFRIGPREHPSPFLVAVERLSANDDTLRLALDTNADGHLDEEPLLLARVTSPSEHEALTPRWAGTASIDLPVRDIRQSDAPATIPGELAISVDLMEGEPRLTLRHEWGRTGELSLARLQNGSLKEAKLNALLFDDLGTGDYRGSTGGNDSGVRLLIDLDEDRKFERDESFDIRKPFTALGFRYRVEGMTAAGDEFRLVRIGKPEETHVPKDSSTK